MHLIVDIREHPLHRPIITRYAYDWVELWKQAHPGDTVSYLIFDGQPCPKNAKNISIPRRSWWQNKLPLGTTHTRDIFRCISFSRYPPYDTRVKTLTYICENLDLLYPRSVSSVEKKIYKYSQKHLTKKSQHLLVPSLSVGQELVEALHVDESKIDILPYIGLTPRLPPDPHILRNLGINAPYWIYDSTYGSEVDMSALLCGYKRYRELGGTHTLLLMGYIGDTSEMKSLTNLLSTMGLAQYIKIIGIPAWDVVDDLYWHANGWIYTGSYYGGGPSIALARAYWLPLLLSDIAWLEKYREEALLVHPHHLSWLAEIFKSFENKKITSPAPPDNQLLLRQYEKLLSEL